MKKIILSIFMAAVAMNANAQLSVDSLGRVGVGTETPRRNSLLSVGTYGNVDYEAAIQSTVHGKRYGLYMLNHAGLEHEIFATFANAKNTVGRCLGGKAEARGSNDLTQSQCAIGMAGAAGEAYSAAGILGCKLSSDATVNYAGIYGTESATNNLSFGNYSGSYAGFFNGKVRVTNGIYATLLSPSASPSPSGQGGTTILSDRGGSVTDKLSQVQAVQFLRQNFERTGAETEKEQEDGVEPEPYLSPIQYGLAADQLKAVYPELVYEDANGNVSINYVEMVPLLVQSINELSAKVAELEGTSVKKAKAVPTGIEESVSDVDMVRMDQNKPNPFSESTVIALNIPEQAQTASIFIYDMSGKQVQNIAVSERGETNITVYASDLTAGMYIYTLVVDGKVAVTRRMIVTE